MITDKQKKIIKTAVIAVLLLIMLGEYFALFNLNRQLQSAQSVNDALSGDVKKYRDKSGAEVTEKNLILGNYKQLQKIRASDSSEIGRLQKLVTKLTISVNILKSRTGGVSSGTTEVVFVPVTNGNDDDSLMNVTPCDTVYPIYKYQDSTKWVNLKVKASKDSTHVEYKVFNEYEISQEFKKTGIWPFRKQQPIVKVRNLNPNTETIGISSYAVQQPKNGGKIAVITGVTAFIAFVAGILIAK